MKIKLTNNSRYLAKFRWQSDRNAKKRKSYAQHVNQALDLIEGEHTWNSAGADERDNLDSGLFGSEIVSTENMMLSSESEDGVAHSMTPFSIIPAIGEIWPNSETEIIVNFSPEVELLSFEIKLAEERKRGGGEEKRE